MVKGAGPPRAGKWGVKSGKVSDNFSYARTEAVCREAATGNQRASKPVRGSILGSWGEVSRSCRAF